MLNGNTTRKSNNNKIVEINYPTKIIMGTNLVQNNEENDGRNAQEKKKDSNENE